MSDLLNVALDKAVLYADVLADIVLDPDEDFAVPGLEEAVRLRDVFAGSPVPLAALSELATHLAAAHLWTRKLLASIPGAKVRVDEDRAAQVLDEIHDGVVPLERWLSAARDAAYELTARLREDVPAAEPAPDAPDRSGGVSWSATRLAATAAGLLPPAQRALYAEEFSGELRFLAEQGLGWAGQVRYSARQLGRAPSLRHRLMTARRRGA